MKTLQEDITDLREALDRAERLYVNLVCSQGRALVLIIEQRMQDMPPTDFRKTQLEKEKASLAAAEKQAREIFWACVHGEIEP